MINGKIQGIEVYINGQKSDTAENAAEAEAVADT